ncbi:ABC transporter substrate-binding protein [Maridesulfovibrio sp. FT414]|uniref:ABC transporter substrate-binding protein n=1 Tax=Maridesulfovibrio sp. FT414 TaxID=2979469 RepID=UPI003D8081FD
MPRYALLVLTMILLAVPSVAHASFRVLLVESYHSEYLWDKEMISGLESVLKNEAELVTFQMDTKRTPEEKYTEQAELAWNRYLEVKPAVVVLSDDNALKYLGPKFMGTETPVVYMGVNENPRNYITLNKNITGVLERPLYKRTIKYIKELLQVNKDGKILILLDESTTTTAFKKSVFYSHDSMEISGVTTDIKLISSYSEWKKTVLDSVKTGYKAIVIGLYHRVFEDGKYIDSEEVLDWTSANTPVPLFAFWRMSVGKEKAIGGMVISGEEQGAAAGRLVLKILHGTPVQSLRPVIPEQGRFVFSKSELERWRIRLPYKIRQQSEFVP